ncbi:MAG: phage holin family protein [Gemmobacter sp.]|jgi:hypothetical protein|nr:phage holin family protein [Gemmobacter sp.]
MPSVTTLIEQLIRDLTELVRSEGRLAKAEIRDTIRTAVTGVSLILAAGALMLLAGMVLVQALVVALAQVMGPGWASLTVGIVLAVVGLAVFMAGRSSLKRATLLPERTIAQISRDGRLAQEQI